MFDYQVAKEESEQHAVNPAVIKVIGCGGGGGNAVNMMIDANVQGVEFIALNTDGQDLDKSKAERKIQIGLKNARGLGAGGRPELGEEAAKESETEIKEILEGSNMVFITAGMGGGTGTGSAPVVARIARELGALTVAVVTYPFTWEGKTRSQNADEGIKRLKAEVDSLIVIPNDKIDELREDLPVKLAFQAVTDILRQGVQGITDIIMRPGLINRDFKDVESIMKGQGEALLGIGIGKGENRALDAAQDAINNPLLKDTHIDGARNILINVCGGNDIRRSEPKIIADFIRSRASEDANIIYGLLIDENMEDEISVTVIATGLEVPGKSASSAPSAKTAQAKRDDTFVSSGEFVTVANPLRAQQSAPRPEPIRPRGDLSDVLGGSVYEEPSARPQVVPQPQVARVPQPQPVQSQPPVQKKNDFAPPADENIDVNDLDKPAIWRRNLTREINLGRK